MSSKALSRMNEFQIMTIVPRGDSNHDAEQREITLTTMKTSSRSILIIFPRMVKRSSARGPLNTNEFETLTRSPGAINELSSRDILKGF